MAVSRIKKQVKDGRYSSDTGSGLVYGHMEDEMRQYCRYCIYMICGDTCYCQQKAKEMTEKQVVASNNCKLFEFTPEDALGTGHKYTPRVYREKQVSGQISIFDYMGRI